MMSSLYFWEKIKDNFRDGFAENFMKFFWEQFHGQFVRQLSYNLQVVVRQSSFAQTIGL